MKQFYGTEAYAHPVRLIVTVAICMPLLANLHAMVAVLLWQMMRRDWLEMKQFWDCRRTR